MSNNSEQHKKELIEVIYKISKDKHLLADFIKDILTPREFGIISARWQIAKRLEKGERQRSIADNLHVGIATVTRGSVEMGKKDGGLRKTLKVIHK